MTTEPPRPDQIQANVAAALSRLRGELAPTPPVAGDAAAAPTPAAHKTGEPILTAAEPLLDTGPSLQADPSMALNNPAGGGIDTPFARMTGVKLTEQPDLLAGISGSPPPLADLPDAETEAAHRKRRLRNRLLAGSALIVALGAFWFFTGRGDSGGGEIPIITAESTPEKVKPADEGGLDVPNQDVAILNGDTASATSQGETVLPAPEQPATPPTPPEPAVSEAAPADTATSDAAPIGNTIPTVAAPSTDAIPTVPAPGDTATATSEAAPVTATSEATPAAISEAAPAETATSEAAPAQTAAVEPTAAPSGGSARIQLAAVKSEAAAQTEWARIQKANPDLLGALTLHVEKFNKSASEVFYRIQAGPLQDKAAAKQLCAELKQKNQACLVAN